MALNYYSLYKIVLGDIIPSFLGINKNGKNIFPPTKAKSINYKQK